MYIDSGFRDSIYLDITAKYATETDQKWPMSVKFHFQETLGIVMGFKLTQSSSPMC